jgi:hypothetical protein
MDELVNKMGREFEVVEERRWMKKKVTDPSNGWYWRFADEEEDHPETTYSGPFPTKEEATEHALSGIPIQ